MPPPAPRARQPRRFCQNRCRTRWHRDHRRQLVERANDLVVELVAIIQELAR